MNKSANPLEFDPRMLGCASTDAPGYYITDADGVIRRIDQDEYVEELRAAGYEPVLINTSHGSAIITSEGAPRYRMTEENLKEYAEQISPFLCRISPEIIWSQVPGHHPDPYDRLAACLGIRVDTLKDACRTFDVRVAYQRQNFNSLQKDVRDRKIEAGVDAWQKSSLVVDRQSYIARMRFVVETIYKAMEDA